MEKNYILKEFVSESLIKAKVKELGKQIAKDYEGRSLLVVGVLKGSVVFLSDLIREIPYTVDISFISVASYANSTSSSGSVRLLCDLDRSLKGLDVLIVEDIVDSGHTLKFLMDTFAVRQPNSLKICTILDKPERRIADVKIDYSGIKIEDKFVVGYGLDYAGNHRNLPYVAAVEFINE